MIKFWGKVSPFQHLNITRATDTLRPIVTDYLIGENLPSGLLNLTFLKPRQTKGRRIGL